MRVRSRHAILGPIAALLGLSSLFAPHRAEAVAFTERFSHTVSLLPDGNVLYVGGINAAGSSIRSVQLYIEARGIFVNLADLPGAVDRASHTATVLPNGRVLVVGGVDGTLAAPDPQSTYAIFDPLANSWAGPTAMPGAINRFNHTANLMRDGRVLICGGQNAGGALNSCAVYDPVADTMTGGITMITGRTLHTATMLFNGDIFFTGGFSAAVTPQFMPLSERFRPDTTTTCASASPSPCFMSAGPLNEGRAYHTATAMGNGKVLIVGGKNAQDVGKSRGFLTTVEIYDPIADSASIARPLEARKHAHSATLNTDGAVWIRGGLGNVTTTYFNFPGTVFSGGSFITGHDSFPGTGVCPTDCPADAPTARTLAPSNFNLGIVLSSAPLRTGGAAPSALSAELNFRLGSNVSGTISQGEIIFSTPQAIFPGGYAYFVPGDGSEDVTGGYTGMRVDLAGTPVTCDAGGCGNISRTFSLLGISGQFGMDQFAVTPTDYSDATGSIAWLGGNIDSSSPPAAIDGAAANDLDNAITIGGIPSRFIGGRISSGTVTITNATAQRIVNSEVIFNITISRMYAEITSNTLIEPDADPGVPTGAITFTPNFRNFVGLVTVTTTTPQSSPVTGAITVRGLGGSMRFVASRVDMSGLGFSVGMSTIIIRSMVFGDFERYTPSTNLWSYAARGLAYFNPAAVMTPSGRVRVFGARTCDGGGACASFTTSPGSTLIPQLTNWTLLATPLAQTRGHHTATPLPSGQILLAGGTNGPSVLNASELFDPVTQAFAATGQMRGARDLHTANLLPNGRVLVAGGFSTDSVSTGAANTSEIYYPETGNWTATGLMNSQRDSHCSVLLPDGNVFVAGGYNRGTYLDSAEIYYSTSGRWRSVGVPASASLRRAKHTCTLLRDGQVLILGGVNQDGVLNTPAVYGYQTPNPNFAYTQGWRDASTIPVMPARAHSHSAILQSNGTVLASWGSDGAGEHKVGVLAHIFDPNSETWSAAISPTNGVANTFNHAATLLPNGVAVFTGGGQSGAGALRSVSTYDVGTSSYTSEFPMIIARAYHTVTLARDGNLYALGGFNGNNYVNSAERLAFHGPPDAGTVGAPPSVRQASVAATVPLNSLVRPGELLTVRDKNLTRMTEGSGGGAATNASHFHPRLVLQAIDSSGGTGSQGNSGFILDLTTRVYNAIAGSCPGTGPGSLDRCNPWTNDPNIFGTETKNSSITVRLPETSSGIPNGWYLLREASNGLFSEGFPIRVGPPLPLAPNQSTGTVLSTTSILWTWCPLAGCGVADAGVDGYNVYYATSGVFITSITPSGAGGNPFFLQTALSPNVTAAILVAGFSITGDGPLTSAATTFTFSTVPVNVRVTTINVNDLSVAWNVNGNSDFTTYEISMSSDDPSGLPSNGQQPFTTSISTPSDGLASVTTDFFKIGGLVDNTTYYIRLRARNNIGVFSNFSALSSGTTRANIQGLVGSPCVTNPTTCIQWQWTNVGPALRYRVYNATVPSTSASYLIREVPTNTFFDGGLGQGTSSFLGVNAARVVKVSAVTAAGEGPLSASATVFTAAALPGLVNPTLTTETTGSITVRFDTNGNPVGTEYRVTFTSSPVDLLDSREFFQTSLGLVTYRISNLQTSTVYIASIAAFNGDGTTLGQIDLASTATWANPPGALSVNSIGPDEVTISWLANNNTSSTTYQVTYSTDDNVAADVPPGNGKAPFSTQISTPVPFSDRFNGLTRTITGLTTGKKYYFRVQASNLSGIINDTFSNQVSTKTSAGASIPSGSLGGLLKAGADTTITGTVGLPAQRTVSLTSPAGAFSSPVNVLLSTYTVKPNLCSNTTSWGIEIITTPPMQPAKPMLLTIYFTTTPVNELGGLNPDQVTLVRYDELSGKCVPYPTTIDFANGKVTALINHLTPIFLQQLIPANNVYSALIFPNPFLKGRDGFVTFAELPAFARVRIYTLRGDLVWDRLANAIGTLTWDGLNKWGRTVGSGIYLVVFQQGDDKKILKLVMLR